MLDLAFLTVLEKTEAGSSVVLVLDSVKECNHFKQDYVEKTKGQKISGYHPAWCHVFNANASLPFERALNRSTLGKIRREETQDKIPKLILTTACSAMGVNLFK